MKGDATVGDVVGVGCLIFMAAVAWFAWMALGS